LFKVLLQQDRHDPYQLLVCSDCLPYLLVDLCLILVVLFVVADYVVDLLFTFVVGVSFIKQAELLLVNEKIGVKYLHLVFF
jgi:hypothetical protein